MAKSKTKKTFAVSRVWALLERREFTNKIAMILTILAVICGFATYAAMTTTEHLGDNTSTVFILINIDAVVMLLLAAIITRRAIGLWIEHKRGVVGARLHARLALIFALLAAVPSALMILFATFFFHFGIQTWFSDRISTAINESQVVAEAYLKEHKQVIRADVLGMAQDLNRGFAKLTGNPKLFQDFIKTQASLRNFSELLVLHSNGQIIARAGLTFSLELDKNPITEKMLKEARSGNVVLTTGDLENKVQAFVQLDNYFDTYVLVGRVIEPGVLNHMKRTTQAVNDYAAFEVKKSQIQITITLLFVMVTLLLLVAAVWLGLSFAHNLIQPITKLINATERVRAGDLSSKVYLDKERTNDDEIAMLAKAFNRMTKRLSDQHEALDERRRFSEAVLSGVSAGVLGLDKDGIITAVNSSAGKLLGKTDDEMLSKPLGEVMPAMEALRRMARRRPSSMLENELVIEQDDEKERTFVVRVASELEGEKILGYVVTFDDISPLLNAQKNAAWSDVARRIAHEIKNPLTPIQLAAERLKRKYSKQIKEDIKPFDECVDTIIRQVDDLRQMVNEFSNFARMPTAKLKRENIVRLVQESVLLFKQSESGIDFDFQFDKKSLWVMCDRQQISQCLINVVKNAVESVSETKKNDGHIELTINNDIEQKKILVSVIDNGKGLPKENRHQLTEPYVTTREKGTGLGLAIVRKIMDDHGGSIILSNNEKEGAVVTLGFAYNDDIQSTKSKNEEKE